MTKDKFIPEPIQCYEWSGARAGELNPKKQAVATGMSFHGAWLTAYMIRRFGPPNHPSDDRKNLCSWTITTPIKGLALLVTPYLADQGTMQEREYPMSLHFGYRWSKSLAKKVWMEDPCRKRFLATLEAAYRWAKRDGITIEGEKITQKKLRENWELQHTLMDAYRERYPRKPDKRKWHDSRIVYRCNLALRKTIRALGEPIMVRDIQFSPAGLLQDYGPYCEPFEKAGWPCKVDQ